jgi:hypothetical protein
MRSPRASAGEHLRIDARDHLRELSIGKRLIDATPPRTMPESTLTAANVKTYSTQD